MLSRVLRGAATEAAQPCKWPVAGAAAAAVATARTSGADTSQEARLAELEQHAEQRIREARQAGFREGEAAGRAQATAELKVVQATLARNIEDIARLRPRLVRAAEAEMVELALAVARRILRRELAVDPNALRGLVKAALDRMPSQDLCRVRAHPELESGLRQSLDQEGRSGIEVVADGALERGALLLETSRGKLDASLETQLREIGCGLADRLPKE